MEHTLEDIVRALQRKLPPGTPALDVAWLIYDWEADTITYDTVRRDRWFRFGVQSPEDTVHRRKGICSDMSVLYCTIARRLGLRAHYADVTVDCRGYSVDHACAVVELPDRHLLVDVAYKKFDAAHHAYALAEEETLTEPLPYAAPGAHPAVPLHAPLLVPQLRPTGRLGARETAVACVLLLSTAYFLTGGEPFFKPKKCCERAHPAGAQQEGRKARPHPQY